MPSSSGAESKSESSAAVEVGLPGNSVSYTLHETHACTLIGRPTFLFTYIRRECALFLMGASVLPG